MGNASPFRRNEEEAGNEEYMEYVHGSPKAYPSALLFTPQVYVTPSERLDLDANQIQCNEPTQNASSICLERMTPTVIAWNHAGNHVAVEGSWDNWKTREFLQRSGREHAVMKLLPSGVYHYRFIVDGQWRCSPDLPQECDELGNIFNILNLQDHKQEIHDNILEYETPRLSSYDNPSLNMEDFSEKVPELPPLLLRTPLDQSPSSSDNLMSLEKPVPAMLNHFYMHKPPSGESVVALSSTQRFRKKYITAVIYKSLKKLKE